MSCASTAASSGGTSPSRAAQQRPEGAGPARRGRLHSAERAGPAEQAALRGLGVGPEQLVGQRRAAAEVLEHEKTRVGVVGDEDGAGPVVGGQRGEQLAAGDLVVERVGPVGRRVGEVVLDHQRARQRERVAHHPRPGDDRPRATAEILGVGQHDAGTGAPAEHPLGGRQCGEHGPGVLAQVVNHRPRPYPRDP